ncbi:MAG: glycosyltransferase family 2 protein [Bdellovibrionaceae bacterium]|nr:glycosyltransferase family 2 protein [Pseudobdellovibrionaceae bacterium]
MVSVVIPTFNRLSMLKRALESVQQQTFKAFEVLVVDDHSTENIKELSDNFGCRYLFNQGQGVSAARNTGIKAAMHPWIAFLDSDDEWLPQKLELQLAYAKNHPGTYKLIHTNETWIRNGREVPQKAKHRRQGGRIFAQCTQACLISPSTAMAHMDLFNSIGLFDESFPTCEDYDFWLRVSSQLEIGFIDKSLTIKHGGHEDQLSMKYHSMDLWRLRALAKHKNHTQLNDDEKLSLQKSIFKKSEIILKGLKKYPNPIVQKEVSEIMKY